MARPRVVRYGATGHRVMRHPSPTQTMTAARAAMTGALARGQGGPFNDPFDPGNGIAGSGAPGSDDLGGMSDDPAGLQSRIAELLGVSAPLRPGDFFSPVGGGTLAGALLSRTGAGRALQGMISSHYGGGFGTQSWGQMFSPGGRFAGRGIGLQLVGEHGTGGGGGSEPQSGSGLPQRHGTSAAEETAYGVVAGALAGAVVGEVLGGAVTGVAEAWGASAKTARRIGSLVSRLVWGGAAAAGGASVEHGGGGGTRGTGGSGGTGGTGGQFPDPNEWVYGGGANGSVGAGYFPTVAGPSSGYLSPLEAARVVHRLAYDASRQGWWGGQWVHLGVGPGGGGQGPMLPTSTVLGGRKHPYDWVALGRSLA